MTGLWRFPWWPGKSPGGSTDDLLSGPIQGDLLGAEHLAERARVLARAQTVVRTHPLGYRARLLERLDATRRVLDVAFARISRETAAGGEIDPSGEWLLDNFHVIQEHIQEIRASLPRSYYRELPELAEGPLAGYPRVYEIAITLISHSEARIDLDNVDHFVEAFQQVEPLRIGELWVVPVMLRLALLESIRRVTLRTLRRLDELADADRWVARVQQDTEQRGSRLTRSLNEMLASPARLTPTFVTRFLGQLRLGAGASPALSHVEHWLRTEGLHPDEAAARSGHRVVHTQLMMANSITSLRTIGRRDWRTFVERQSVMDAVLRRDPAEAYDHMTFVTRDRYRHVVERLSRRGPLNETDVAEQAITLARTARDDPEREDREGHVGYYLVDDGLPELERLVEAGPALGERIIRAVRGHPDLVLVGGLAVLTALALLAVNLLAGTAVVQVAWPLILAFTFLPAWDIGITTINQLVTAVLPPQALPGLDFRDSGVPTDCRTAVVVPTLFASPADVQDALDHLEVTALANTDDQLHFVILSDFVDAPDATMPGDDAILAEAEAGIAAVNARYPTPDGDRFHLLHRPRRWNARQQTWMGWERKRGKLTEFNRLLRGGRRDDFAFIAGDVAALQAVRYVITLDADTTLPPGSAIALIGTIAHPLNRAVYDPARGDVVAGYGILQPRVGISLASAQRSRFATILSGQPGLDPYTTAVSDVYQDLYGQGSFTGKGIYDVDAFTLATRGRFPENTLLSHDLIEGNYARAGLTSAIIVYDDVPSGYLPHARRKHRWIRGDWQLLPWLRARVPGPAGPEPNRLSLLSRWKIVDNLRRSTVEIAQFLFIVAGWTVLAGSPLRWTLLGLGAIAAPWVVATLLALIRPPRDKSWRAYYGSVWQDAVNSAEQFALAVIFLPHQVWLSLDAILRTLYRLWISHRRLLEWVAAAQVQRQVPRSLGAHWRAMAPALLTTTAIAATALLVAAADLDADPERITTFRQMLLAVVPLTLIWLSGPWLAVRLGPRETPVEPLDAELRATTRRYAERHWQWFDRYVTEATHWLAPDNVQFDPAEVVAMRTSPTNIGLQLLATASAHDLGLINRPELLQRLEHSFTTLGRLERFRGHFYNWYALDDLRVLQPAYVSTVDSGNLAGHLLALRQGCLEWSAQSALDDDGFAPRFDQLAAECDALVRAMQFDFLFDASNRLLTIGYHPDSHSRDDGCYDLLASEARLAVFIAIAKGDVPNTTWFRLGRQLVRADGSPVMVSWSGSAFEYLMPLLVMRSFAGTLLDQSHRSAVRAQIAHGREHDVPWGVSESAYNLRDKHLTYQYRAFGIPALALKRGLARELVIAPYATALAALVQPATAIRNLIELEAWGALGTYGFWDALDFTRPAPGKPFAMVQTVMAHHAGMTLVALTNVLHDNTWQQRFHAEAIVRANELLLQERVPRKLVVQPALQPPDDETQRRPIAEPPVIRRITQLDTPAPRVVLLGDLPYTTMVSHAGSGRSRYDRLAVTRWRQDGTTDAWGQFCYVTDLTDDRTWSVGHQPTGAAADEYAAEFAADRATITRRDGRIETRTEIVVVSADAAEVRRVTLTNHGHTARDIELTSYAEIALGPDDADAAHPAFANLFVETEWHEWCSAITAKRRPRRSDEMPLWCVHLVDAGPERIGGASCETDRARFIGRGRSVRNPAALDQAGPLLGTTGAVLDPVAAIRVRVRVAPGESVAVAFTTLVASTRERAFELADRYHDSHATQRALDVAWMATQIDLREAGLSGKQVAAIQELAGHLLYARETLRPPPDQLERNRGSQSGLWNHGVSGDLPILLATIHSVEGLPTLRDLFVAHRYLRRHGLECDLVVVVAEAHDYLQQLRKAITEEMITASDGSLIDQPGGVFIRRRDTMDADDYLMFTATARAQVQCDGRSLASLMAGQSSGTGNRSSAKDTRTRPLIEPRPATNGQRPKPVAPRPSTPNGFGALDDIGNYRLTVHGDHLPPAPWINVIANPHGGCVVSERGTGCTWAESAYFFRLTPWHNDPVGDPACDVIYLRDVESGDCWSATPAPKADDIPFEVRHGPGASTFAHRRGAILGDLTIGVPADLAVKVSVLQLTNRDVRPRTIEITAYAEWTLGVRREVSAPHVRTWYQADVGAVMAQNRFESSFAGRVAFLAMTDAPTSHSGDRARFLGRHGHLGDPAALGHPALDDVTGSGLDPCGALRCRVTLAPGASHEIAVLLGCADGESAARDAIAKLGTAVAAREAVNAAVAAWQRRLSVITVQTPDPEANVMLNRWTLYQALSSRMWARTGLYQSSGAYGFRDQLQDVMAFVYAEPQIARAHLLRAASRQFVEGDVQHWWHPHSGSGVRTRFSDDLAWLPFVVEHYLQVTDDHAVLDESVPFLAMRALKPDEHEIYEQPMVADESGSLYEHCLRALRRACTRGVHGLPLIGSGDWNDGFSRIGIEGRGESIWLAWFLIVTCRDFAARAEARGDAAAAAELRANADEYAAAVEQHGWDGEWYRRAYFDDGTPLGTADGEACRIDSIAQSWSVISGAGSLARQTTAMASLRRELVDDQARLIALLTPPFDQGTLDPGYIKGYLPGVRENGGQYTHGALWAILATALQGDGDTAWQLFRMINPLTHAATPEGVATYRVEPYVVAADVYTAEGHLGRGGWTWYTGSASWFYRVGIETLLGFTRRGNSLTINPRVPASWPGFTIDYRHGDTAYHIEVRQPAALQESGAEVTLDGKLLVDDVIPLVDDGSLHNVVVAPRR